MNASHFPHPLKSSTAAVLDELTLYALRPGSDEPDYRPLPETHMIQGSISGMVEALTDMLSGSRLEDELEELAWSLTNVFQRRLTQTQRLLDDNEAKQRDLQLAQDGSEVRDVELQRLVLEGYSLTEQRNAYELMRDVAADQFHVLTGSPWVPRTGSKVSQRNLTATLIESRDFVSAKRRTENETHCPAGTRIAFTGGIECQDLDIIWRVLDATHAKYPDMILLHGGSPKGAELIAAKWAENRKVIQVVFKPNWKAHNKAAPFKRNDALLEAMPVGLIACAGNGITDNLIDKARKMGIAVKRVGVTPR